MTKISDAELMAYADGVLSPRARPLVRQALAEDPTLLEKLEGYIITSRGLAEPFERLPPLPPRTRELVRGKAPRMPGRRPPFSILLSRTVGVGRLRDCLLPPAWSLAAMMCLTGAAVVVWLLQTTPGPAHQLARLHAQGLVLSSPFQRALENVTSGVQTQLATLKPMGTFLSNSNEWCRQYELVREEGARLAGVACRNNAGEWRVKASIPMHTTTSPSRYEPAGQDSHWESPAAEIEATVDRLIKGIVLLQAEERKLIAGGWRVPQ
jgi:hypothetical protein